MLSFWLHQMLQQNLRPIRPGYIFLNFYLLVSVSLHKACFLLLAYRGATWCGLLLL